MVDPFPLKSQSNSTSRTDRDRKLAQQAAIDVPDQRNSLTLARLSFDEYNSNADPTIVVVQAVFSS